MITEKTITTWLAEFNRMSKDGTAPEGMEYFLKLQASFCVSEPMMVALVSTLYSTMDMKDPVSAAIFAFGIFHDLSRRQKESDALSKDAG